MNCFPFEDPVVVLELTGKAILDALENAISLIPALEGRYPQVSNITFEYHASAPVGSRVAWANIGEEALDQEKTYKLATRGYMGRGKDGFTSLLAKSEGGKAEEIVSEENGVLISMILRQYFLSLKIIGRWRRWGPNMHRHWDGVHDKLHNSGGMKVREPSAKAAIDHDSVPIANPPKHGRNGSLKHPRPAPRTRSSNAAEPVDDAVDSDTDDDTDTASGNTAHAHHRSSSMGVREDREQYLRRSVAKKWMRLAGIKREHIDCLDEVGSERDAEFLPSWTKGIAPTLEGRIRIIKVGGR